MEVTIQSQVPDEYKTQKGTTYETRYIYTGFGKYDTEQKTYSKIEMKDGKTFFHEAAYTGTVFPRAYHTELVRVTLYSKSPRAWKEDLSPTESYFFLEKGIQNH